MKEKGINLFILFFLLIGSCYTANAIDLSPRQDKQERIKNIVENSINSKKVLEVEQVKNKVNNTNDETIEKKNNDENNNEDIKDKEITQVEKDRNRLSVKLPKKDTEIQIINGIADNIDLDNILLMELKDGVVIIKLFPDVAPWHTYRIKLLTAEGFYNNLSFHRVIENFIAQTGDPKGNGTGGSKYGALQAEISKLRHKRGTVSMARANDLDSANSQFFIVLSDKNVEHLDGQYTIFGEVIQGMEFVDKIKKGSVDNNGLVVNPDKILKMRLGQEMNYNYEGDTQEEREERRKARIEILRNLYDLKKMNDQIDSSTGKDKTLLLDKIFELNAEL